MITKIYLHYRKIISTITIIVIVCTFSSCRLTPTEKEIEPIIITFPDINFESLIREELELPTGNITNQDLWLITALNGEERNIADISGIEHCSGLRRLNLKFNSIINIEPLVDLVLLNYIDLSNNQVVDIRPLVENQGIGLDSDIIDLNNNPLSDESIYQYQAQLKARGVIVSSNSTPSAPGKVFIADENFKQVLLDNLNKINDEIISSELEAISNLNARGRNIMNINGIEYCTNLDTLDLGKNQIIDVSPLSTLGLLVDLKLDDNLIEDISSLNDFPLLKNLQLNNNKIISLGNIWKLNNIINLNLSYNNIQNFYYTRFLTDLQYLSISGNPIIDYIDISRNKNMLALELNDMSNIDFEPLADLQKLITIYASNTPITDLSHISQITSLENIVMRDCQISDISAFETLVNLKKLLINNNNISDISSLSELYNLFELELGNNNISDIKSLVDNWGIAGGNDYVYIYNNPLSEVSINTYIPILQERGIVLIY